MAALTFAPALVRLSLSKTSLRLTRAEIKHPANGPPPFCPLSEIRSPAFAGVRHITMKLLKPVKIPCKHESNELGSPIYAFHHRLGRQWASRVRRKSLALIIVAASCDAQR